MHACMLLYRLISSYSDEGQEENIIILVEFDIRDIRKCFLPCRNIVFIIPAGAEAGRRRKERSDG